MDLYHEIQSDKIQYINLLMNFQWLNKNEEHVVTEFSTLLHCRVGSGLLFVMRTLMSAAFLLRNTRESAPTEFQILFTSGSNLIESDRHELCSAFCLFDGQRVP